MKYKGHFDKMQEWGMLIPALLGTLVFMIVGYFCVKKDEKTARAIFSGRAFSKKFHVPTTVNLEIPEVLVELQRIADGLPEGKWAPGV
jgi:hypothetical protein